MITVNTLKEMYDSATKAVNSGIISYDTYLLVLEVFINKISDIEECWEDNGVTGECEDLDLLAKKIHGVLKASL